MPLKLQKTVELLILLPFIYIFSIISIMESASKILVVTVVISFIFYASYNIKELKKQFIDNMKNPFCWVIILFTIYIGFLYKNHDVSNREIRTLLCLSFLVFYFPFHLMDRRLFTFLCIIGSSVIFTNSIFYLLQSGYSRWAGVVNPIPYAIICATILLLNIYLLINEKCKIARYLLSLSILFSFMSILLTQTRGVWIAIIFSILILLKDEISKLPKKFLFISLAVFIMLLSANSNVIKGRIQQSAIEIERINNGDLNSSFGLRIQMWKLAPKLIQDNYLFGLGRHHSKKMKTLYENNEISQSLYKFNPVHYHNQFIDIVIRYGVLGFLLIIGLLFTPIIAAKRYNSLGKSVIYSIVSLYIISGLTDVPFFHTQSFLIYISSIFFLDRIARKETGYLKNDKKI
ncbi:O-antigen ligase family protein [Vibrio cincinnatiensis]